mmetsp:Transcript_33724/g.72817  ORF Transcript_33724/g.72817 Transcript_33724/m.72817 type:complete len:241 (+) Transcript_33724:1301-2023(+)
MGHDTFVWSPVIHSNRCDQRRLKPSTVLILALQVQIHRGAELLFNICPRRTRVEPDIHGVCAFLVLVGCIPIFFWKQVRKWKLKPCIAALLLHNASDMTDDVRIEKRLPISFAIECRDWHTPRSLPRNTPIASANDHGSHAIGKVLRNELDFIHRFQHLGTKSIDACEPLWSRSSNDRLFASPIVWVLVGIRLSKQKQLFLLKHLCHFGVRILEDVCTDQALQTNLRSEVSSVIHWRSNL